MRSTGRRWRAPLLLAANAVPLFVASTARAAQLPVSTPQVTVPVVTVPVVTVPTVPVTIPTVTVPSIPTVTVPVTIPTVTVPTIPTVTVPVVTAPTVTVAPATPSTSVAPSVVAPTAAPPTTATPVWRSTSARVRDGAPVVTPVGATQPPTLAAAARKAATPFALPLGVMLVIAAYVVLRGLLDRRDARLASAPVHDRWVRFR